MTGERDTRKRVARVAVFIALPFGVGSIPFFLAGIWLENDKLFSTGVVMAIVAFVGALVGFFAALPDD